MIGRVAAVLLLLELAYLGVGNAVLRSGLVQRAVGTADGFHLDFAGAYTLWPGHVRVRNFSLRVEDYNVQFEVAIERADLDIALGQLPFKKFRVTRIDADGTRFRMRHKLITVGDDAERVAAFPPISGFADPPYYVGVHSPPIPDSEYDLWQVRVENVKARVRELWIMEYRFLGAGEASGSFVIKPARWVQVEPAHLQLDDGRLTLGPHVVAEHVRGRISCDVPDMHVQETHGREVFREISTQVKLELTGGRLTFLNAYLARLGVTGVDGSADFRSDFSVLRGVIQPASRASMRAAPLQLGHDALGAAGELTLELARLGTTAGASAKRDEQLPLRLELDSPRVAFERRDVGGSPPSLEGLHGVLQLNAANLTRELSLGPGKLTVRSASAPSLAWFDFMARGALAGSAQATLELERDEAARVSGRIAVNAKRVDLRHGSFRVASDVQADVGFVRGMEGPLEIRPLRVALAGFSLQNADKRSEPTHVAIEGTRFRIELEPSLAAKGQLELHVGSARALLPLLFGATMKNVTSSILDLQSLDAQLAVALSARRQELKVLDGQSGKLRLRGHLRQQAGERRGAFLLSSGPVNVGVTIADGETDISPFVADGWLGGS